LSRPDTSVVVALGVRDPRADRESWRVLANLEKPDGVAIAGGRIYVSGGNKVVAAEAAATPTPMRTLP
jgi:hypothetical protein